MNKSRTNTSNVAEYNNLVNISNHLYKAIQAIDDKVLSEELATKLNDAIEAVREEIINPAIENCSFADWHEHDDIDPSTGEYYSKAHQLRVWGRSNRP